MKGFISYSHEDYRMFREFRTHLKAIERAFGLDLWADTRIKPGYYWSDEIAEAIDSAELFVLLTSPGFIASDYIYNKEIPAIRARHRSVGVLVVPVVLKRCYWSMVTGALQAVPTENGELRPIVDWKPQRDGFDCARSQIGGAVQAYFGLTAKTIRWKRA
jgi:hypothetical protein